MEAKVYSIMIVDDHKIFRQGLRYVLERIPGINIIAEASNGKEFLNQLNIYSPDIVLMDISMQLMNGIEATEKAIALHPDLKIIALSMFGDEYYYQQMITAGARGFIIKTSDQKELLQAIQSVAEGDNYFSQELLRQIIYNLNPNMQGLNHGKKQEISQRELEVLEQVCHGLSNEEIADKLNISRRTVEGHKRKLLMKTDSKNTSKLIINAIKNKLVRL
jgi:DNA-binding NarL/FixJ family response regulator